MPVVIARSWLTNCMAAIVVGTYQSWLVTIRQDALIFEEDSNEIEWHGWGTEPIAFPDLPVEETSTSRVFL